MSFVSMSGVVRRVEPMAKLRKLSGGQIIINLNKSAALLLGESNHVDFLYCDETDRIALKPGGTVKVTKCKTHSSLSITSMIRECNPRSLSFKDKSRCQTEGGMLVFKVPRIQWSDA